MDDSSIIALFFERSEQALSELSGKYGALLRKVTGNILADPLDAEEAVNDTLLAVWNAIPPEHPDSLPAYAVTVARRQALKRYRTNTAEKRNSFYDAALDELSEFLSAPETVESAAAASELTAAVNAFLGSLPRGDRQLFVARYWLGLPVTELAARVSENPKRVSMRLFRLRTKLKKALRKEGLIE